jgi:hypothetical protein
MLRVARHAKAQGVALEIDMAEVEGMDLTFAIATRIVTGLGVPVRIAVPARYEQSAGHLRRWAALARQTGLPLGVRLVKGSFVEAEAPGAINQRRALLDNYKRMITLAMEQDGALDIAVATHNEEIFDHAEAEAVRLGADYKVHVIRGVAPEVQAKMARAGRISREYVSYGADGPAFGLHEMFTNWQERRKIRRIGKETGALD